MLLPKESQRFPGFFEPRGYTGILISQDHRVLAEDTANVLTAGVRNHGYLSVSVGRVVNDTTVYRQYLIHRLYALAFLEIPEELSHLPLSKIQVNHKDGDKLNNAIDNLEWVRAKRNMRHAFETGLINIGIGVLAKDVRTDEIKTFPTIVACAEAFNIQVKKLQRHLNSGSTGRVSKEWHVFKKAGSSPWPTLHPADRVRSKWEYVAAVIAERDGQNLIFNSIREACAALKLNYKAVKNSRSYCLRKGKPIPPFEGWSFHELDSVAGLDMKDTPPLTRKQRYRQKTFTVTNLLTQEETTVEGIADLSRFIDYSKNYIENCLRDGKETIGDFHVIQGQRGLTLAKV